MKHLFTVTMFLALLLTGCASSPAESESQTLVVFAAASLTDAFIEVGENFEAQNPGVTVTFNFAGSQALRTQIEEGAPADVFASANNTQMDAVVTSGSIAQDAPQIFLNNKLVIIVPESNPAGLESVEDLAKPGLKLVLAAEEVPVGRYSREAFDLMNSQFGNAFKDTVLANVVSNEDNVKQVMTKVQLGEADAGIVYTSDAVAAPELPTVEIPTEINVIAEYPIAPLLESDNADLAQAFIDYILSGEGQSILQKWGFNPKP